MCNFAFVLTTTDNKLYYFIISINIFIYITNHTL